VSEDRDLAALLQPGTLCLVLSWHGWPCCYGRVGEHGVAGDTPTDVWYAVEALTPVIDWGVPDPAGGYVSREPGDVFNAHHNELVPLARVQRTFTSDVVSTIARLEADLAACRAEWDALRAQAAASRAAVEKCGHAVLALVSERDAARADAAAARESEKRTIGLIRAWWEAWADESEPTEDAQRRLIAAEVVLIDAVEAHDRIRKSREGT
jgi:hypothetical protein